MPTASDSYGEANCLLAKLPAEQIHLHPNPSADTEGRGAGDFFRSVAVFDPVDGLVEVDGFRCIVEQADLVIAVYESAQADTHEADQHSPGVQFIKEL